MAITGVTILAIFRQLDCNCTSIEPFWLPGPATLAGVIGYACACSCAYICLLGLRPVWALIPGHSLRDLPLVGARGGGGSGSCCRGCRVLPCKQLTPRHQNIVVVVVVVGNDEWVWPSLSISSMWCWSSEK